LKLLEQPGGLVLEAMALGRGGRAGEEVMRLVADRGTAWLHTEALLGRTQRHCLVAHRGTALGMMLTRLKYENVCKNAQCGTRVWNCMCTIIQAHRSALNKGAELWKLEVGFLSYKVRADPHGHMMNALALYPLHSKDHRWAPLNALALYPLHSKVWMPWPSIHCTVRCECLGPLSTA